MNKKGGKKMLSTRQFAELHSVHYATALRWLNSGLVPDAIRNENPAPKGKEKFAVYWSIPLAAAKVFVRPTRRNQFSK